MTHRLVAESAGVSLAATTYYYETKADIIAAASARLLAGYVEAFRRFAERHRHDAATSFRDFAVRLVINAAGRYRTDALAWCEIILDGARHQSTRLLARAWFARLVVIWSEIARVLRVRKPEEAARSAIDTVIGLLLTVIPLGLQESQIGAVLRNGVDPRKAWGAHAADAPRVHAVEESVAKASKSAKTRDRILTAAISLLQTEGASGVTYRAIAAQAGLTASAPIYHYPSIESLLQAAQARLFESSKSRYRLVMAGVDPGSLDVERLADLTATVLAREATEFALVSLADYPVRLEAARHTSLRAAVWGVVDDQNRAWSRLLRPLSDRPCHLDAVVMQSLFVGKLVRLLATGATTEDVSSTRRQFLGDLRALVQGRHWMSASTEMVQKIKNR